MLSRLLRTPAPILGRSYATAPPSQLDGALRTALKQSMKARDSFRSGVIKSALADLQTATHTGQAPAPPSKTLARAISTRLDGAATFDTSNPPRPDLATQYRAEAAILAEFAVAEPASMAAEELDALVQAVMADLELESVGKDMGRVIKAVVAKSEGKAAGKDVSEAVKRFGQP